MGLESEYTPHVLMTLCYLGLAILIVLLQSLLTTGLNSLVFVFYEHFVSTLLLCCLSFFFERGKRPPFKLEVLCWTFFLGFLEIPLCQLLLTASLNYITATFQSTALNTVTATTFVIAVIFRQETFQFCSSNGQAKMWGIVLSAFGATTMVLWTGPKFSGVLNPLHGSAKEVIGSLMVVGSVLAAAYWNLLVERAAIKYPAEISLAAMMCLWGTLQTGIIAGLTERDISAWKISFHGSYELAAILYGASLLNLSSNNAYHGHNHVLWFSYADNILSFIIVTGLFFCGQTWVIHKKGPVFATAFAPLLIVFTFLLETLVLREAAHLGSIVGAVFVVIGLYLILCAKADDTKTKKLLQENLGSPLIDPYEQSD